MELTTVLLAVLGVLQTVVIGFCKVLLNNFHDVKVRAEQTSSALSEYKLHVAENYVTHDGLSKAIDNLSKAIDNLSSKLDRIEDKLGNKQDKI